MRKALKLSAACAAFIVFGFLISSCATSPARSFSKIKIGMPKDQVLSQMGSPRYSTHFKGEDHWFYMYFDHNMRTEREVDLQHDAVIYAGPVRKPKYSARQIDEANSLSNRREHEEDREAERETSPLYRHYKKEVEKKRKQEHFQDIH